MAEKKSETRAHASEALRQSEERFRLLVESVQDYAIFMLDPGGHIASWNRGAEHIKGYTEEEILGQHFSIFYPVEDRERHYPDYELQEAARVGRFEDEGWRMRKDGTRFWANVVITALRDENGVLVGFGKVTRDLTDRIQVDAERRALEAERAARQEAELLGQQLNEQAAILEEQATEMESVNEQLMIQSAEAERARAEAEEANRAKSIFLANMSHELRTPINAIIGYGELMEMGIAGPVTDGQRAQLERVRMSSQHLLMLIEDILDLSKIEAGRVEIAREPGPIGEPVEAALSLLSPQAADREIELANRCTHSGDVRYVGDDQRVRQILVNLLSNAVKFTEPGGKISLVCDVATGAHSATHLDGEGAWVRVRVEDTGIGIPADKLSSIFEPFVQVENSRTRTRGGTGLGLAISQQLARLMGGDLTAESELGEGSAFTLWLPRAP